MTFTRSRAGVVTCDGCGQHLTGSTWRAMADHQTSHDIAHGEAAAKRRALIRAIQDRRAETPTFARALSAGLGVGWTKIGTKQDEPASAQTLTGSERQSHSMQRMEDDA